jgi:hypothetical protein
MTISNGPIRFFRSASRNSATVLASTPALRAPRPAVRAVVLAALRAFCWRPRACPPFLAAAVRLDEEERELDADERELEPDERELEPDERELDPDERELEPEERLRELADERLLLDAERPLDERLLPERLDPLDFFLPPELPLLRRSAICSPSCGPANCGVTHPPK